jgi:hypothetical protein
MSRVVRVFGLVLFSVAACGPASEGGGGEGGEGGGGGNGGCQTADCYNFCPTGTQTTLSGVVTVPNGIDPVPGAIVYVPRFIEEFPAEVTCEVCGDVYANAFVQTTTNPDGSFTLGPIPTAEDQPPGTTVTVIAQKGRFRRVVEVPIANPCSANSVTDDVLKLPARNEGRDTIPNIAVATGDYDAMECVLNKLGIDSNEIDLYEGTLAGGFPLPGGASLPGFDTLLSDPALMKTYNIIFINCTSDTFVQMLGQTQIRQNILDYVESGGRLYVTDWSYNYIEQIEQFSPVIDFEPGGSGPEPEAMHAAKLGTGGVVVDATVHDPSLAEWLRAVEARTGDQLISAQDTVRVEHFAGGWVQQHDVVESDKSKVWLSGDVDGMSGRPLTATHDYAQCGRWLFSSYHTAGDADSFGGLIDFPSYCPSGKLTPQERVLAFLILHVADCLWID